MFDRLRGFMRFWREHEAARALLAQERQEIAVQRDLHDTLMRMASKNAEDMQRLVLAYTQAADAWKVEVARLNEVAGHDAQMIRALMRWCEKKGCKPRAEDLKALMK